MADASMLSAPVIIGFAIALILNAPLSFPLLLPVTACLVYYVGQRKCFSYLLSKGLTSHCC